MKNKPKTLQWLCNSPTSYNAQLFDSLSLAAPHSLVVTYLWIRRDQMEDAIAKEARHPWRRATSPVFDPWLVWRAIRGDQFVIGGWSFPLYLLLMALCPGRYFIWTDVRPPETRGGIRGSIRRHVVGWALRRASGVFAMGELGRRQVESLSKSKLQTIDLPYVIQLPEKGVPSAQTPGPLTVMVCGRLAPEKNVLGSIRLLGTLKRQVPDLRVVVVGDGPLRDAAESEARAASLDGSVRFTGWIRNDELRQLMKSAHVLLHLAEWEPYGVVILEAMAAGMVVCASRTTVAAVDRIDAGAEGFIVDPDDDSRIVATLVRLNADRSELSRIGNRALTKAYQWQPKDAVAKVLRALSEAT